MTGSGLGAGFPLGLRQHHLGLDAGAGVNQVVAEEDLRGGSAGSTVLGHVVSTDVDCSGGRLFHELDGSCGIVGTAHTVGLAFGGLDDQEDAPLSAGAWSSLKVKVSPWHTMVAELGASTELISGGVTRTWPPRVTIQ